MTPREAIDLIDSHQWPTGNSTHWADLGAGSGTFTLALAHFLSAGSTIEAMDRNPTIRQQTTKTGVLIQPRTADFTTFAPEPHSLDGIVMANSLHYVADKPSLLRKLHAALKPGAIFLLVEYDTDIPVPRRTSPDLLRHGLLVPNQRFAWLPYPLSFPTATGLFAPPYWSGFKKINTRSSAFGRGELYAATSQKITPK